MKPQEMLKKTTKYLDNLNKAKALCVVVGLPQGTNENQRYSKTIYKGVKGRFKSHSSMKEPTVLEVGAMYEYGHGAVQRSFLQMPLDTMKDVLVYEIDKQFNNAINENFDVKKSLERIGITAYKIVLRAFDTKGFGKWADISAKWKKEKGSEIVLVHTTLLKSSIAWMVRNAS